MGTLTGKLIQGSGQYSVQELTAQDSVLKHLDKGTKYFQCDVSGTCAFASTQSFGEWEFNIFRNTIATNPIYKFISRDSGGVYFYALLIASNGIRLQDPTGSLIMYSANSYITEGVMYRIKITRTLDGEFTVYIRGGSEFGDNDWTLVDPTGGAGTNPIINTIYTESKYFVVDLDAGDRIANIITRKAVAQ